MIPDQYPNYYKPLEIHIGYFDSLDIMIIFFLSQQYRNNERLLYNHQSASTYFLHFSQLYMLSPLSSSWLKKAARQSFNVIFGPQNQLQVTSNKKFTMHYGFEFVLFNDIWSQ